MQLALQAAEDNEEARQAPERANTTPLAAVGHTQTLWVLVLPPLGGPHWQQKRAAPFACFFELSDLATPSVTLAQFLEQRRSSTCANPATVETALHLISVMPPSDGSWGHWHATQAACGHLPQQEAPVASSRKRGTWRVPLPGWDDRMGGPTSLHASHVGCIHIFGPATTLVQAVREVGGGKGDVLVTRLERTMQLPPDLTYWTLRRGMVFKEGLREHAERAAMHLFHGHPYLAVHLRRGDFLVARRSDVVTAAQAASALLGEIAQHADLRGVFVATDATGTDRITLVATLSQLLPIPVRVH